MLNYFRLSTDLLQVDLTLRHKYYLIDGFSGVGKSLFVSEVDRYMQANDSNLQCSLPIIVVLSANVLDIDNINNTVLICDEELANLTLKRVKGIDCYCIIVSRKIYANINMSYESLYIAERSTNVTRILPKYSISSIINFPYDTILLEDSGAGFIFYSKFLTNIISTKGKNNIVKNLEELPDNSKVLLIADAGGLASVSKQVFKTIEDLKEKSIHIDLCLPECFEHVLMCSEFLRFPTDIKNIFLPRYDNTENFCERILELNTRCKPYYHNHKNSSKSFSKCWTLDCKNCCDVDSCEYSIEGDKLYSILKNGPVTSLLKGVQD